MRYHISSHVNGLSSFDCCPFCLEIRDGHPDDIIQHMNDAHDNGKWKLLQVVDGKNRINLACPESDFAERPIPPCKILHSNEDESPDRNALGV